MERRFLPAYDRRPGGAYIGAKHARPAGGDVTMALEHGIILSKDGELFKKLELIRRENELALDRNIICRLGFMKSLDEPGEPAWEEFKDSFSTEGKSDSFPIKKDVLTGKYHNIFVAQLKQRIFEDSEAPITEDVMDQKFKAHIARGVIRLVPARARKTSFLDKLL